MPGPGVIPGTYEFQALDEAHRYRAGLLREFGPYLQGDVLEVGAGIGHFSAPVRALPSVRRLLSVEPDPRLCAEFRRRHPALELVEGTVESVPAELDWDAVLSINVLEHIADDAAELARYRARLARRAGHLCLFVPAGPELYAPVDRDFGHFRRYTRDGLRRVLGGAGFRPVRLHYFNSLGYLTWWLLFRVLGKRQFNPSSVRFFDRILFPVVHGLESRVLRPPLGQNLLAIARAQP